MDMGRGEERVRCVKRVTWKLTLLPGAGISKIAKGWEDVSLVFIEISKLESSMSFSDPTVQS